jgi:hypothetical protein
MNRAWLRTAARRWSEICSTWGARNDSGIVLIQNRPYEICIMTSFLRKERDGEDTIARISAAAYRLFDRMGRASEYGRVVSPNDSSH